MGKSHIFFRHNQSHYYYFPIYHMYEKKKKEKKTFLWYVLYIKYSLNCMHKKYE